MTVRLAGFERLSPDLPANISDAVDAEIEAAFNSVGVIGVSTAPAPAPGAAPAYALGGTIQRDGKNVRVITRLTNERSGATLWSNNHDYDGGEVARVPRRIAVDTGNVVRCGLFGASTYRKALPDPVMRDYMLYCQGHWDPICVMDARRSCPLSVSLPQFRTSPLVGRAWPPPIGKCPVLQKMINLPKMRGPRGVQRPIGRSRSTTGTARPCISKPCLPTGKIGSAGTTC